MIVLGNMNVHFSSKTDNWATPQAFFDELNREFNFTLDPCADDTNHKCAKYYTKEDNGLTQSWDNEIVFCNPPYGREIKHWVKKASETAGGVVVMLIPARTDTTYFHDYIYNKAEIRFIRGRLIFGTDDYWKWVWEQKLIDGKPNKLYKKYGKKNSAPFPSMIVIFKK